MAKNDPVVEETPAKKGMFSATGRYTEGPWKGLRWGELDVDGDQYRLRQMTVTEGDENYDAAYNERTEKFNGRLNSRLNLAVSIVTPETSIDTMGAWPGTKLVKLLTAWDELNLLKDADAEGNA